MSTFLLADRPELFTAMQAFVYYDEILTENQATPDHMTKQELHKLMAELMAACSKQMEEEKTE